MPERVLPGEPGLVCRLALARVEIDPLVDLISIRAVIGDRRLNQAERDPQVLGRGSLIAVVVANHGDGLPDVEPGSEEPWTATGRAVNKADQRMLVGPQPLLDVALGERARRNASAACSGAEAVEGCVG